MVAAVFVGAQFLSPLGMAGAAVLGQAPLEQSFPLEFAAFVGLLIYVIVSAACGATFGALSAVGPPEPRGAALCTEVTANGYSMVVDEPVAFGGTGAGPTPYNYLLAAFGSCTVMTVCMYADRKGWPLESVRVHMNHSKIHARDCEECETENGRIDRIELELDLKGSLDEQQRLRLGEIAEKCPVHRTLDSEVLIETRT